MKAYVARDRNGVVAKGWLLRRDTRINSAMCRLPRSHANHKLEEVSVEVAVRGAARGGGSVPGASYDGENTF